ncbi:hypothetical protein D3C76_1301410 [compost metagenome]
MLLQGRLQRIVDQFVLDQLGVCLTDVDLARHFRQVRNVQPVRERLCRLEPQGGLIRCAVLQGVLAECFGVHVERIGQCQSAGFETVGDGDLEAVQRQPGGGFLIGNDCVAQAVLGVGREGQNPHQFFVSLFVQFSQRIDGLAVLIQIGSRSTKQPIGY